MAAKGNDYTTVAKWQQILWWQQSVYYCWMCEYCVGGSNTRPVFTLKPSIMPHPSIGMQRDSHREDSCCSFAFILQVFTGFVRNTHLKILLHTFSAAILKTNKHTKTNPTNCLFSFNTFPCFFFGGGAKYLFLIVKCQQWNSDQYFCIKGLPVTLFYLFINYLFIYYVCLFRWLLGALARI